MAAYENVREVSVVVGVNSSGVAAVLKYRFAKWLDGGVDQEVTVATGVADPIAGVISQKVPTTLQPGVAYKAPAVSMVIPGGIALVELGEAVTSLDVGLRTGTAGKAFLSDATGDGQIGMPLELGSIGQIIRFQFQPRSALHA
jgi:hypothetical protein